MSTLVDIIFFFFVVGRLRNSPFHNFSLLRVVVEKLGKCVAVQFIYFICSNG